MICQAKLKLSRSPQKPKNFSLSKIFLAFHSSASANSEHSQTEGIINVDDVISIN